MRARVEESGRSGDDETEGVVTVQESGGQPASKPEMLKAQVSRTQEGLTDKFKATVEGLVKVGGCEVGQQVKCSADKPNNSYPEIIKTKTESKSKSILIGPRGISESGKSLDKSKINTLHENYKGDNIKYYGELKGYDFKSYGNIDKPPSAHEKSHQFTHEKNHAKSVQGYNVTSKVVGVEPSPKSVYSDKYSDSYDGKHFYHRSSHAKPNVFQVYQETKYSYNVSGVPGTPAQASAAAAFFAR